jgi:hypothetical protein
MNRPLKKLLILLLALPQFSHAQNSMFDLGIEGGFNRSQFLASENSSSSNLPSKSYSGNISPSIGVNLQVNTRRFFSFKTGVSFDRKTYTTREEIISSTESSQRRYVNTFDYLSIPLLGKLTFGKKVQLFMNAGVYFAILANQNIWTEGSSIVISQGQNHYNEFSSSESTINRYKRCDFGLIGGIGIGVPIKKHWYISLEAREVLGVMKIYDPRKTTTTTPPTKQASFQMLLGVSYKLGFYDK